MILWLVGFAHEKNPNGYSDYVCSGLVDASNMYQPTSTEKKDSCCMRTNLENEATNWQDAADKATKRTRGDC